MSGAALAPERWRRVRPLLDRALDLTDDTARAAFLAGLSGEAAEFRADLERLLRHHEITAGLTRPAAEMAAPALAPPPAAERRDPNLGRQIGPFQLTRLLGAGGMGAVYAGERVEGGFRQRVAIKLVAGIHPGLTARFERERQILAELRHPHIAQLLDGGETPDGMPYFALEYVEGESLADYVEIHQLDLEGRIKLLVEVAEALAYAHRRGVIHRDLKPGNILVTAEGDVKLLDFGIAKLIDRSSEPTLTHHQVGPMTPEYAAPEQFRGATLGVYTDVYQFGVLSFRLLTGRLPYRASAGDALAWAKAVSEQEAMSLNEALRDGRRHRGVGGGEESTLKRMPVRGGIDLNQVFRRCMAKDPASRYPGMDALIADLQAWCIPLAGRRGQASTTRLRWALAAAVILLSAVVFGFTRHDGLLFPPRAVEAPVDVAAGVSSEPGWEPIPALVAHGFHPSRLHVSEPATTALIRQALLMEAAGDAPAALAMLSSAHKGDPKTPVPALLIAFLGPGLSAGNSTQEWLDEARRRIEPLNDAFLDLYLKVVEAERSGNADECLRYYAALLAMQPDAWFLRFSRAHTLTRVEMPEAALKELQAIEVRRLEHRRQVDAIADRAALGDLAGARAVWRAVPKDPGDPMVALLDARLLYTEGDLVGARDQFREVVRKSRTVARLDLETRGLLWAGALAVALGDNDEAAGDDLRAARIRLASRQQYRYAIDAALLLAHLSHWNGDAQGMRMHLQDAIELNSQLGPAARHPMTELVAARLAGDPIGLGAGEVRYREDYPAAIQALLAARAALLSGDRETARTEFEKSRAEGVGVSVYVEEAALLAQELGLPGFELPVIDPPFPPLVRMAARREMGAGRSVAPKPVATGG